MALALASIIAPIFISIELDTLELKILTELGTCEGHKVKHRADNHLYITHLSGALARCFSILGWSGLQEFLDVRQMSVVEF